MSRYLATDKHSSSTDASTEKKLIVQISQVDPSSVSIRAKLAFQTCRSASSARAELFLIVSTFLVEPASEVSSKSQPVASDKNCARDRYSATQLQGNSLEANWLLCIEEFSGKSNISHRGRKACGVLHAGTGRFFATCALVGGRSRRSQLKRRRRAN